MTNEKQSQKIQYLRPNWEDPKTINMYHCIALNILLHENNFLIKYLTYLLTTESYKDQFRSIFTNQTLRNYCQSVEIDLETYDKIWHKILEQLGHYFYNTNNQHFLSLKTLYQNNIDSQQYTLNQKPDQSQDDFIEKYIILRHLFQQIDKKLDFTDPQTIKIAKQLTKIAQCILLVSNNREDIDQVIMNIFQSNNTNNELEVNLERISNKIPFLLNKQYLHGNLSLKDSATQEQIAAEFMASPTTAKYEISSKDKNSKNINTLDNSQANQETHQKTYSLHLRSSYIRPKIPSKSKSQLKNIEKDSTDNSINNSKDNNDDLTNTPILIPINLEEIGEEINNNQMLTLEQLETASIGVEMFINYSLEKFLDMIGQMLAPANKSNKSNESLDLDRIHNLINEQIAQLENILPPLTNLYVAGEDAERYLKLYGKLAKIKTCLNKYTTGLNQYKLDKIEAKYFSDYLNFCLLLRYNLQDNCDDVAIQAIELLQSTEKNTESITYLLILKLYCLQSIIGDVTDLIGSYIKSKKNNPQTNYDNNLRQFVQGMTSTLQFFNCDIQIKTDKVINIGGKLAAIINSTDKNLNQKRESLKSLSQQVENTYITIYKKGVQHTKNP
jgi:hypothetical protein